jgi:hypothetical protein
VKPRKRAGERVTAMRASLADSGEGNVRWYVAVCGGGAVVFEYGRGVKMVGCFVTLNAGLGLAFRDVDRGTY